MRASSKSELHHIYECKNANAAHVNFKKWNHLTREHKNFLLKNTEKCYNNGCEECELAYMKIFSI